MLWIVRAKIWCLDADCIAFINVFACHCRYCLPLGGALNTSGFEIPKRGVNSAGPFEVCNTGLQWPALWSFSSLLADDLFVKLLSPFLQLDNIQIMMARLVYSLLFPSVPDVDRVTPNLSLKWSVSSLWTQEYLQSRVLAFKFSPKSTFNEYKSTLYLPDRQCRVRLPILCQQSNLVGPK